MFKNLFTKEKETMTKEKRGVEELAEMHDKIKDFDGCRKVAVFIDQENVFYASLHNANSYPNFKMIMEYAATLGKVVRAEAVCDWTRLYNSIRFVVAAGIEPKFCCNASTVNDRADGKKQSYADCQIYVNAIQAMLEDPGISVFVLVAGSRDYVPLVNFLKSRGKFVIVLCEKVSIAWDLESVADLCFTLQEIDGLVPAPEKQASESQRQ